MRSNQLLPFVLTTLLVSASSIQAKSVPAENGAAKSPSAAASTSGKISSGNGSAANAASASAKSPSSASSSGANSVGASAPAGAGMAPLDIKPATADSLQALSEKGTDEVRMREPEWQEKHANLVKKAHDTTSQLQFFGDSITEYMNRGGLAAFQKKFAAYKPDNFGLAGDKTNDLFWRMNHGEMGGQPKVIVVMIGTNDLAHVPKRSAQEVAQNIANVVKTIHAREPKSKILLMALLPRDPAWAMGRVQRESKRKDVNAAISKLDNGGSLRFIDIGSRFVDQTGLARQDLMPDYLHPNQQGYEVWAEAVKPTLDGMLKWGKSPLRHRFSETLK
jgi:lysophospholipase L1-like esterase